MYRYRLKEGETEDKKDAINLPGLTTRTTSWRASGGIWLGPKELDAVNPSYVS